MVTPTFKQYEYLDYKHPIEETTEDKGESQGGCRHTKILRKHGMN